MSFTVAEFHDLVRLMEERPEWRAELRRLVLTDELLALPEQVARLRLDTEQGFQHLAAQVVGLTAAQTRTEEQLVTLSQAQTRMEEQLVTLSQAQARTEEELRWLVSWQRGEAGRRDGERYERDILRQAPALFNGGQGGATDHPDVQRRLTVQLGSLLAGDWFDATDNPFLADLVWWKGEQMVVVEVSVQVDRQDVGRAERRAATLRRSGASVMALVIGEQWATPEAREQAQTQQVDWKVGADLSEGFLTFRRRRSP
jgi:hypothetical protein